MATCEEFLKRIESDPGLVLTTTKDCFGNSFKTGDLVIAALQNCLMTDNLRLSIVALTKAHLEVYANQLGSYRAGGSLATLTSEEKEMCSSAAPHNIWAERTLGMTTALWKRAPNASLEFLESKVKVRENKTLEWLDSKVPEEQQRIIKWATKQGRRLKSMKIQVSKSVDKEIGLRLKDLAATRERKQLGKEDKRMRQAFFSGDADNAAFEDMPVDQKPFVKKIVKGEPMDGALIRHSWNMDGEDVVYWGRIQTLKEKNKIPKFRISYWRDGESELQSEDEDHEVWKVLTDVSRGDFMFL